MKIWNFSLILSFCFLAAFLITSFVPVVLFEVYPLFASILLILLFLLSSFLLSYFCCLSFNVTFNDEVSNEKK